MEVPPCDSASASPTLDKWHWAGAEAPTGPSAAD